MTPSQSPDHINMSSNIPLRDLSPAADQEYSEWMLDDHPIRSFPRECCPGLSTLFYGCYHAARRNWSERCFRVVCVVLTFLVLFQLLSLLPGGVLSVDDWREVPSDERDEASALGLAKWPVEFRTHHPSSNCISYFPRPETDAVQRTLTAGCAGIRTEIWFHDDQLLVGKSLRFLHAKQTLRSLYLDPVLEKLTARNDGVQAADRRLLSHHHDGERPPLGLFLHDDSQTFTLVLDLKVSARSVWEQLALDLRPLREKGYLSYINGTTIVHRPVTVVIPGKQSPPDTSLPAEIFLETSLDEMILAKHGGPLGHWNRAVPGSPSSSSSKRYVSQRHPIISRKRSPADGEPPPPSTPGQVYSASTNFRDSIGFPRRGRFSSLQMELIRAHVRTAREHGLRVRYEGIPARWPGRLRDMVWRVLVAEGVDLIEIDWRGGGGGRQRWWRLLVLFRRDEAPD